jgi:hypothetical protein
LNYKIDSSLHGLPLRSYVVALTVVRFALTNVRGLILVGFFFFPIQLIL